MPVILTKMLTTLLTEKLIMKVVTGLLTFVSKETDNKVDDEIIALVKDAYYGDVETNG